MTITLDLTQRHFVHSRGVLTAIGTWVRLASGWEPCLALVRTGEEKGESTWPCVITQTKAWIFEERTGDGARAALILHSFLGPLRLSDEPRNMFALHSLVHDLLDDFLKIPPFPPGSDENKPIALADLTITDKRTGRTVETVLTDV